MHGICRYAIAVFFVCCFLLLLLFLGFFCFCFFQVSESCLMDLLFAVVVVFSVSQRKQIKLFSRYWGRENVGTDYETEMNCWKRKIAGYEYPRTYL